MRQEKQWWSSPECPRNVLDDCKEIGRPILPACGQDDRWDYCEGCCLLCGSKELVFSSPVVALNLSKSIYPEIIDLIYKILEFLRIPGLAVEPGIKNYTFTFMFQTANFELFSMCYPWQISTSIFSCHSEVLQNANEHGFGSKQKSLTI